MKEKLISKLKRYSIETLKLLVIIIVMANVISYLKRPELPSQTLPEIEATLIDNRAFTTASVKGEPLMIHFWATWCPTCKTEAGNIDWVANHFSVLSIAVKSGSNTQLSTYMKERDLTFKVLNDEMGLSDRFSVAAYPTTFIYDSEGNLAFTEVGYTSAIGLYLRMWWAK